MSKLEDDLAWMIRVAGLPDPEREYRFHPSRRWRADFAWETHRLLVECEGGLWIRGRHNRADGYERDLIKYNTAALAGRKVLRFSADQIDSGYAITVIEQPITGLALAEYMAGK